MLLKPTSLSRALVKQRKILKLTPQQVAEAIKRAPSRILSYESGEARPTPPVLAKLGEVMGRDFAAEFPLPGTAAKELLQPANVRGRLHHLIGLVTGGVQHKFAAAVGIPKTAVSNAVTGRWPLSSQHLEAIYRVLPGLSSAWLAKGKGEPFAGGVVPVVGPAEKPRVKAPQAPLVAEPVGELVASGRQRPPKAPSVTPKAPMRQRGTRHPNAVGMVLREVLEVPVYDQCSLTGGFTFGELDDYPLSNVGKMGRVLWSLSVDDCGLTKEQVTELAVFLMNLAKANDLD